LEDYSGMEFVGKDKDGNDCTVCLPADALAALVENLSAGIFSINKNTGASGTVCLPVKAAAAHTLNEGEAVGVELAFGSRGHLYFALPPDVARKLAEGVSTQLKSIPLLAAKTPGQPN
jgi:hypothetical protein